MNQVFVGGTYFHIYVSILKSVFRSDKFSKTLFINNNFTPGIERIQSDLEESGFFDECALVHFEIASGIVKKKMNLFHRMFDREQVLIGSLEQYTDILHYDDFIRHSEINLFHHVGLPSSYFILKYPKNFIRMLEDGSRNYHPAVSYFKHFKRKYVLNTFIGDGLDESVKEIHVQYPERLPARVRHKGVKLDLKGMQGKLRPDQNERILNVFMRGQIMKISGARKLLLITQTLSEDGYTSEEYKIQLYKEIIRDYAAGFKLFIKPHPRETTNYREKLDCDFVEIPRSFPMEMFDLMQNIQFDCGITISCHPIYNIECIHEKIMIGKEFVKEHVGGKVLY